MIYSTLLQIGADLAACLPGPAVGQAFNLPVYINYCGDTPLCDSYLSVSSEGPRFVGEVGGGNGTVEHCASIIALPVTVKIVGVCQPTLSDNGTMPTIDRVENAWRAAYQQMENLAGCISTLPYGGCDYRTRPAITCGIEGNSYVAEATFEITIDCFELDVTGAPCC